MSQSLIRTSGLISLPYLGKDFFDRPEPAGKAHVSRGEACRDGPRRHTELHLDRGRRRHREPRTTRWPKAKPGRHVLAVLLVRGRGEGNQVGGRRSEEKEKKGKRRRRRHGEANLPPPSRAMCRRRRGRPLTSVGHRHVPHVCATRVARRRAELFVVFVTPTFIAPHWLQR